jgi:hypothetical protein
MAATSLVKNDWHVWQPPILKNELEWLSIEAYK